MGWFSCALKNVKWLFGFDEEDEDKREYIGATPFVTSKPSPMYFDEDGDLAEEFYVEILPAKSGQKPWMQKITENLTWQGFIKLEVPRLHVDFPVAIYQG